MLAVAALYLLLATGVATTVARVMHGRSDPRVISPPVPFTQTAKYLVLMVLDGARPDYFDLTPLPHVDALRAQGAQFTNAMAGILESETPSGHATLATGSTPARDGILGFSWAQNDSGYSLFSPDMVRAGAIEHIMEAANVPTIAGLYKARFPRARVVALSGHKYYAADPLGGPQADAIMYYQGGAKGRYLPVAIPGHTPPAGVLTAPGLVSPTTNNPLGKEDTLATRLALSAFRVMRQRLTLINYPEFDWPLGHVNGGNTDPAKVIQLMKNFDRDLGMIEDAYRKAGVLDKTLFVITADHGMAPVTRFVPQSVFTNAVAKAGATAPTIGYSTGTYIWLTDQSKAPRVARNILAAHDPGIQSVYYLTTAAGQPAPGRGKAQYVRAGGTFVSPGVDAANRYLLATLINGHEPSVVAFCRAGATSSSAQTQWRADHGGAGWQAQHIPLILAGPGIQAGVVAAQPAQLEDVAPTLLTAMGVKPTGMEGTVLTEALQHSGAANQKRRRTEADRLTPIMNALVAQDNYESSLRN
jgi:hypothetical protein